MGRFYFSFIGVFGCMLHTPLPATLFDDLSKFDKTKMAHASKSHEEPSSVAYEAKETSPTPLRLVVNLQELQAAQGRLRSVPASSSPHPVLLPSPEVSAPLSTPTPSTCPMQMSPEKRAAFYKESVLSLITPELKQVLKPLSLQAVKPKPLPEQNKVLKALVAKDLERINDGIISDSERLYFFESQVTRERGKKNLLVLKKQKLEDLSKIMCDPGIARLLENPDLFDMPMGFAMREKVATLNEAKKNFDTHEIDRRQTLINNLNEEIEGITQGIQRIEGKLKNLRARIGKGRIRFEKVQASLLHEKLDFHRLVFSPEKKKLRHVDPIEPVLEGFFSEDMKRVLGRARAPLVETSSGELRTEPIHVLGHTAILTKVALKNAIASFRLEDLKHTTSPEPISPVSYFEQDMKRILRCPPPPSEEINCSKKKFKEEQKDEPNENSKIEPEALHVLQKSSVAQKGVIQGDIRSFDRAGLKHSPLNEPYPLREAFISDLNAHLGMQPEINALASTLLEQGYVWRISTKTGVSLHAANPEQCAHVAYSDRMALTQFLEEVSKEWGCVPTIQNEAAQEAATSSSSSASLSMDMGSIMGSMIFMGPSSFNATLEEDATNLSSIDTAQTAQSQAGSETATSLTQAGLEPQQKASWTEYLSSFMPIRLGFNRASATQTS